jgi:hypothetical protein
LLPAVLGLPPLVLPPPLVLLPPLVLPPLVLAAGLVAGCRRPLVLPARRSCQLPAAAARACSLPLVLPRGRQVQPPLVAASAHSCLFGGCLAAGAAKPLRAARRLVLRAARAAAARGSQAARAASPPLVLLRSRSCCRWRWCCHLAAARSGTGPRRAGSRIDFEAFGRRGRAHYPCMPASGTTSPD